MGQSVATDSGVPAEDVAVVHCIVLVALKDLDKGAVGTDHDAHVVRPAGGIAQCPHIPVVVDDIAGQGKIAVLFFPAGQFFPKTDLPLTAAFRGNAVRQIGFTGAEADEGGAPVVVVFYLIALGQELMGVVGVDDGPMTVAAFLCAQVFDGDFQKLSPTALRRTEIRPGQPNF